MIKETGLQKTCIITVKIPSLQNAVEYSKKKTILTEGTTSGFRQGYL